MKRALLLLLSLVLILSLVIGCNKTEIKETSDNDISTDEEINEETQTIKFYFPGGVPALTVAKLAKENPAIDENINIEYKFQNSPDLLVTKVLKEEADIAIMPSNLAAQVYNKGIPYKLSGTSVWGTLYLMSTEDIDSFQELKEKEIYSFGKSLTPDLVFKYILSKNNISLDADVVITYLNAASEVGPAFISGKTSLAVLSEPAVTNIMMKKENAKVIFDLNEEWSNITGAENGYPQASLIIKSDLIENNREFVENFIEVYEENLKWAKNNPEKLGEYAEELEIGITKDIVTEGIERMNIGHFDIKDTKEEYKMYYEVLLDFAPEVIGGKLPDEGLYFER
ncbi:ABC transporter substrate-binding protein [Schnuerera sp. xch1]|uniref:ABC transporter substrate-binding protein n=1 Tax=Schnuerera sp. xch1 TaxID=2874283 RepID=UPI001CBE97CA|nr:MqnA/MqnD/SBP family protein [Schnuerera sp. xch1]MBZ2175280.1 ABC transporter substrate-binding protein [Schnuerera sp. xch1]